MLGLCPAFILSAVWGYIDFAVAWIFGMDQSKYQWAIDKYHQQAEEVRIFKPVLHAACDI